ncbi:hypothetical protein N7463_008752, partial [Penicillium fimorum]
PGYFVGRSVSEKNVASQSTGPSVRETRLKVDYLERDVDLMRDLSIETTYLLQHPTRKRRDRVQQTHHEYVSETINTMTLSCDLHFLFSLFDFAFEATSVPHTYRLEN